ncbi:MAG: hypothetical protein L7U87_06970 [Chlamydiales bacterium]|nr:hypothetical protein [Chlamydiales bacterium]
MPFSSRAHPFTIGSLAKIETESGFLEFIEQLNQYIHDCTSVPEMEELAEGLEEVASNPTFFNPVISDNSRLLKKLPASLKKLTKKVRVLKSKARSIDTSEKPHKDTTILLPLESFSGVHYTQSTVASNLSTTEVAGGPKTTLADLEKSIRKKGWDKSKAALKLCRMPDGSLTSYDNRRLYVIKRILVDEDRSLASRIQVPVIIHSYSESYQSPKDVRHFQSYLSRLVRTKGVTAETVEAGSRLDKVRQECERLIGLGADSFTYADYYSMRICADGLTEEAHPRAVFYGSERAESLGSIALPILGYSETLVRS